MLGFGLFMKGSKEAGSFEVGVASNEVILEGLIRLKCLSAEWTLNRWMKYHLFLGFGSPESKEDGMHMPAFSC